MSKLSQQIFKDAKHKISSPFGKREVISTSKGNTSPFHSGTDYSTYGVKLPQYAVSDGTVTSCGIDKNYGGAKYVWIMYKNLGVNMLHYHLDSISVKSGQKLKKGDLIGYTGKTGRATGIHLHLGIKRIGSSTYIDPEKWSKNEFEKAAKSDGGKNSPGGEYVVTTSLLYVRSGASVKYGRKSFNSFTKNAQRQILALCGEEVSGYVRGVEFTALETKNNWARTPSGWVCLDYCKRVS